jgi:hypothetical protein
MQELRRIFGDDLFNAMKKAKAEEEERRRLSRNACSEAELGDARVVREEGEAVQDEGEAEPTVSGAPARSSSDRENVSDPTRTSAKHSAAPAPTESGALHAESTSVDIPGVAVDEDDLEADDLPTDPQGQKSASKAASSKPVAEVSNPAGPSREQNTSSLREASKVAAASFFVRQQMKHRAMTATGDGMFDEKHRTPIGVRDSTERFVPPQPPQPPQPHTKTQATPPNNWRREQARFLARALSSTCV